MPSKVFCGRKFVGIIFYVSRAVRSGDKRKWHDQRKDKKKQLIYIPSGPIITLFFTLDFNPQDLYFSNSISGLIISVVVVVVWIFFGHT